MIVFLASQLLSFLDAIKLIFVYIFSNQGINNVSQVSLPGILILVRNSHLLFITCMSSMTNSLTVVHSSYHSMSVMNSCKSLTSTSRLIWLLQIWNKHLNVFVSSFHNFDFSMIVIQTSQASLVGKHDVHAIALAYVDI